MTDNSPKFGLGSYSALGWLGKKATWAVLGALKGPSATLEVDRACGYTGGEIVHFLKKRGVHTWEYLLPAHGQTLTFKVRKKDANFARDLVQGLLDGDGTHQVRSPWWKFW